MSKQKGTIETPEAWNLERVRMAVQGVVDGADLSELLGISSRHVGYALQAGRILGWLERSVEGHVVTARGHELLATSSGTGTEATLIRLSLAESPILEVVPSLLEDASIDEVARILETDNRTQLARTTARKRAATLIKWREQLESRTAVEPTAEESVALEKSCDRVLIIHLSDIHFRRSENDNPVLSRASGIVAAVVARPQVAAGVDACWIVVSGDVAFSGRSDEYSHANRMLSEIVSDVRRRIDVEALVVAVAGNHDCDFSEGSTVRETLLAAVDPGAVDAKYVAECTNVQANFRLFASHWHESVERRVGIRPAYAIHELVLDGRIIHFQLFNTAWMSSLHEQQGQLVFPTATIDEVENSVASPAPDLVVSVFHHPYAWLETNNARAFRTAVERTSDVVLTGHEHVQDGYSKSRASGEHNAYLESGVLQDSDNPDESSFNTLVLDLVDLTQTAYSFTWSHTGLYEETETYPAAPFHRNQYRLRNEFQLEMTSSTDSTIPASRTLTRESLR